MGLAWVSLQALWSSKFECVHFKLQARATSTTCVGDACALAPTHFAPIVAHSTTTHFVPAHFAPAFVTIAAERWSGR